MIEVQCPNCNKVTTIKENINVPCKKCLESTGKKFIMVETNNNQKYNNLGDGFFEKI